MNAKLPTLAALALLPVTIFGLASCSSSDGQHQVSSIKTSEGAVVVDTVTMSATVFSIDRAKRKVTLVKGPYTMIEYEVGSKVDLDQIHEGDTVKATVAEEVAVYAGEGSPPSSLVDAKVTLAPKGAQQAMVDTVPVRAKVTATNVDQHKVTFQLPDGTTKTVKAGNDVDVSTLRLGEYVMLQISKGYAISLDK